MKTLLANAFQLQNIHNESKVFDYSRDESELEEEVIESSLGSITSGDEDDCAFLFNGAHQYRFQAEESIK